MKNNLSHIFCLSSTQTDSNRSMPKLRVLAVKSRILNVQLKKKIITHLLALHFRLHIFSFSSFYENKHLKNQLSIMTLFKY